MKNFIVICYDLTHYDFDLRQSKHINGNIAHSNYNSCSSSK